MDLKIRIYSQIIDEKLIQGKLCFFNRDAFIQQYKFNVTDYKLSPSLNGSPNKSLKIRICKNGRDIYPKENNTEINSYIVRFITTLATTNAITGIINLFAGKYPRINQIAPPEQVDRLRQFDELYTGEISLEPQLLSQFADVSEIIQEIKK